MFTRNDTLWKGIIEELCIDFLRLLYPNADEIFDFRRKIEFLDKELSDILPQFDEHENIRQVDKLIRVYLKNGKRECILIHIEVQGKAQKNFSERMFYYYILLRNKFKRKITAWAILADTNKQFVLTKFEEEQLGTNLAYTFNSYKIIHQGEKLLEQSNNPFASVILTVLLALKKNKLSESNIGKLKVEIFKNLYRKKFPPEKIRAVENFLKNYVRLNEQNTLTFEKEISKIVDKSYTMGIEQQILQQERSAGQKEGVAQGVVQGDDRRLRNVIRNARVVKKLSIEFISEIVDLSPERVRLILDEMGIN